MGSNQMAVMTVSMPLAYGQLGNKLLVVAFLLDGQNIVTYILFP